MSASNRHVLKQPKWDLAYLFAAHFADGSQILQTPDDISVLEPETRSAFYDVQQRIDSGVDLVSFALFSSEHVYAVDLRDGHFEFKLLLPDGGVVVTPFVALPISGPCLPPNGSYRIIYFRDHQQDLLSSTDGSSELGEHRVFYRLGWEYACFENREPKVYSMTITIV